MALFNRRGPTPGVNPNADEQREQRLDEIKRIAERFTYDLGLLIAGHPVPNAESWKAAEAILALHGKIAVA